MGKNSEIVLSICIPTYNRKDKVIGVLDYLIDEGAFDDNRIEVLVSDNCSDDNTYEELVLFKKDKLVNITILQNSNNVGLTGNILKLSEQANGHYIWLLGDDDLYHNGLVRQVLNLVCQYLFTYIFINHSTFTKAIGDGAKTMLDGIEPSRDDSDIIIDLLKNHPGAPMFMSANIYKKDLVQEFIKNEYPINICLPLGFSIYCASKGKVGIIQESMIDDNIGNVSWTDIMYKVDLVYRPFYYRMALRLPFSLKKSLSLYIRYIIQRRNKYFYYWIIKPLKGLLKFN